MRRCEWMREVALEAQEQVLAVRVDGRAPRGLRGARASGRGRSAGAACASSSGTRPAQDRADPVGRVVDGVALGHCPSRVRCGRARRSRPHRRATSTSCPGTTRATRPTRPRERRARRRRGRRAARATPSEVAAVVAWCYEHDVPIVPRGGGTGWAGGAVAARVAAVVLALERLNRVRSLDPLQWRMERRGGRDDGDGRSAWRARTGCCFPPDPGAAEQSQIGGNVATNAGGPHCLQVRRDRRAG